MSLQRVFESARKMGVPVIVTDPSGRDPLVVLPLEQFEAMSGEQLPTQNRPATVEKKPAIKIATESLNEAKFVPPQFEPSVTPNFSEIPPEERFYLEPMDDADGVQG